MRNADGAVNDAEVMQNFRKFPDGGTWRPRGCFLFDGDGRRKAFDYVNFGTLHLVEELPGIGRKRFDVAALALGINGVKGEGGLARAGKTGDNRQGIAGDFEADVFEIVLPRAPDNEFSQPHETKPLPPQEPRHPVGTLSPR